jgi:hypothetical protein
MSANLGSFEDREDRAAGQLTSDPRFVARVKAAVHGYPAPKPRAAGTTRRPSSAARLEGPRPKLVDMAKVDGSVFCGSFRHEPHLPSLCSIVSITKFEMR